MYESFNSIFEYINVMEEGRWDFWEISISKIFTAFPWKITLFLFSNCCVITIMVVFTDRKTEIVKASVCRIVPRYEICICSYICICILIAIWQYLCRIVPRWHALPASPVGKRVKLGLDVLTKKYGSIPPSTSELNLKIPKILFIYDCFFLAKICKYSLYESSDGFCCGSRKPSNHPATMLWIVP